MGEGVTPHPSLCPKERGEILVLGVGNPFRRDDGIGPAVIARLQGDPELEGIEVRDGGTDGLSLLEYVRGYDHALIIDAVDMGLAPGDIRVFTPVEARLHVQHDALSTHGFGLADALALMDKLDMQVNIQILGIQAKDVSFGEEMSQEVSLKIEDIVQVIKHTLRELK